MCCIFANIKQIYFQELIVNALPLVLTVAVKSQTLYDICLVLTTITLFTHDLHTSNGDLQKNTDTGYIGIRDIQYSTYEIILLSAQCLRLIHYLHDVHTTNGDLQKIPIRQIRNIQYSTNETIHSEGTNLCVLKQKICYPPQSYCVIFLSFRLLHVVLQTVEIFQ